MKTMRALMILVPVFGLILCTAGLSKADVVQPMGTAFTYQGRLIDSNSPADDLYDLQFKLYNYPTAGTQQGGTIDINSVDIIDGYFTVELDFGGAAFDGGARWLEIGVRPGASPAQERYTILSPRQELTPTPYALYAQTAGKDNDWMISGDDMYSIPGGNVGIGTVEPLQKLEVAGTTKSDRFRTTLNSGAIGLEMNLTSAPGGGCAPFAIWDARNGGAGYLFGVRQETDNLVFRRYTDYWEGNLGIMTLEAGSGNVGIRTGSPGSQLTVNGLVESMAEGFKFPDGTIQETAAPGGGIPLGVIIMWSGSLSSIPAGWALCDGTNGTPDLRDRFILSVSAGQNPGGTGGSHQVTLTVSQMPAHEHSVITNPAGNHRHDYLKGMMMPLVESGTGFAAGGHETAYTGYSGTHTHTGTALSTGGGQPFDNRPAYYKLAFIMKL